MNTAYYVKREKIDFVVFFLLIKVLLLTGTLRWSIGAQQAPLSSHFFVKVVLSKFEFNLPTQYYTNTCDTRHRTKND